MIAASIRKEVQLLAHDRGRLLSLFALPVAFMLVFGSMFELGPDTALTVRSPIPISGFQVAVPGNAVLFGFFIAMAVAMSFASERHTGVWRRLLAAPVPRWRVLVGKLVPYYLISVVQLGFLFGLGAGVFGMRIAGSPIALAALSLALSACAVTLGLLIASFGGSEKQIGSIVPVALLIMGLIGGCMFPRLLMPPAMRELGHAVPHSWALDGYTDVLIVPGTGLADVIAPLVALVGFALAFAAAGVWRFRAER
ncbi:MAG TPA: ABC transporter permease [Kofleriaceae bacterium]|nr:ABC transporter permease [Kofleriaceae bacterium]